MKFVKSTVTTAIVLSLLLPLVLPTYAETTSFQERVNTYKINRKSDPLRLKSRERKFEVGVKWGISGSCGNMDMDLSILNNINSADLKQMWNNWISQAKAAFSPGELIALAFKRANPDLYDIMQNGIITATAAFDEDMDLCNTIQNGIVNNTPDGAIDAITVNEEFSNTIESAYAGASVDVGNVTDFIRDSGAHGFDFMGLQVAGDGQPDAEVIDTVAVAGFNIAAENTVSGSATKIDLRSNDAVSASEYDDYPFAREFAKPSNLAEFLKDVIGEVKLNTSDGKNTIEHGKGAGAKIYIHELSETIGTTLASLIVNTQSGIQAQKKGFLDTFNAAHSRYGANITGTMLEELRGMPSSDRGYYVSSLSREWALNGTVNRLVTAKKLLYIGSNEASVAAIKPIKQIVLKKISLIDEEIVELERDYRIKKEFTNSTSEMLFSRALGNSQKGIVFSNKIGTKK
jgi:integrating conjugative element protein (TIGR03755 family)